MFVNKFSKIGVICIRNKLFVILVALVFFLSANIMPLTALADEVQLNDELLTTEVEESAEEGVAESFTEEEATSEVADEEQIVIEESTDLVEDELVDISQEDTELTSTDAHNELSEEVGDEQEQVVEEIETTETITTLQTTNAAKQWQLSEFSHTIEFLQPSGASWIPVTSDPDNPIPANTGARYGISYKITLPNTNPRVQPGDTLVITLPQGIDGRGTKALQLSAGETIANLSANGSEVTVTFTDEVANFNNVVLDILADVYIFSSSEPDGTTKTITVNAVPYYFYYHGGGHNPNFFTKRGDAVSRDLIRWTLFLNYGKNSAGVHSQYTNLTITDTLMDELNLIEIPRDQLTDYPANLIDKYINISCFDATGAYHHHCPTTLDAKIDIETNGVGKVTNFKIIFNAPVSTDYEYFVHYFTNALDNGDAKQYKNNVVFSFDEGVDVGHEVHNAIFGGGATGEQAAIKINKVDGNDEPINGATFQLEKKVAADDWQVVGTKSIEFGQARFSPLLIGEYRLTETVFPDGYGIGTFTSTAANTRQDGASYYFEIVQSDLNTAGNAIEITVKNVLQKATLEITKTDKTSNLPLEGAVFELVNTADATIKYELTTDAQGFASNTKIKPGTYTLKEKTAPNGYVRDTSISEEITFAANDVKKESFTNEKYGQLTVTKVDSANPNTKLSGAVFTLANSSNTYTVTTDNSGIAQFNNVLPGTYTLTETTAPNGYVNANFTKVLTFGQNPEDPSDIQYTHTLTVQNEKLGQFTLTKVHAGFDVSKLKGARFKLERFDGTDYVLVDDTFETNELGIISKDNLARGQYRLIETVSPAGYYLNITPIEFTIGYNAELDVNKELKGGTALVHEFVFGNSPIYYPPTPVDPVPTDPTDPNPTDPVDPTDPTDPEPTDPVDPTDPEPTDPTDPVDPVDPPDSNTEGDGEPPTTPSIPDKLKEYLDKINNGETLTPEELKELEELYLEFLNLPSNVRDEIEQYLDLGKIEELVNAPSRVPSTPTQPNRLPQTNGASTLPLTIVGLLFIVGAMWLFRLRKQKI